MRQRRGPNHTVASRDDVDSDEGCLGKDGSFSPRSPKKVFLFCLVFRIVNALLIQTRFHPDEHWQGPEVAHRLVFGYGQLTWEWEKGLRGYLHPMIFAALYKVLAVAGLDTPWFMINAPKLLQSVFCAIGDLYLYKLSVVLLGRRVAEWALFSELTNWFMFFCFPRTFSNSFETVLTLAGLYYWPCLRDPQRRDPSLSRRRGLVLAAISCAIRPTSAIIWLYIGLLELYVSQDRLKFLFLEAFPIGQFNDLLFSITIPISSDGSKWDGEAVYCRLQKIVFPAHNVGHWSIASQVLVLGLSTILDRLVYGSWVLAPLNFLKFNFLSSGADMFGTHKWHWYFSQGFTAMLLTFIPFTLAGIFISRQWCLAGLVAWVLGLYSLIGHKEFRFVLPVLPIALMFSGVSLAAISSPHASDTRLAESSKQYTKQTSRMRLALTFLLATNVPMALYCSLFHQRGSEDVMNFLSVEAANNRVKSILLLTPCHSTPFYSILHRNLPMQSMDCSPSEDRSVPDESDRFMMDPLGFASDLAKNWLKPSHIVLFDSEERQLKEFLSSHSFKEIRRFFHAHFKVDRHLQASIVVYAVTS